MLHSVNSSVSSSSSAHLRNDSLLTALVLSHHRVALARAGLAVREDADVVAFECVLQHLNAQVLVHFALCRVFRIARLKI